MKQGLPVVAGGNVLFDTYPYDQVLSLHVVYFSSTR